MLVHWNFILIAFKTYLVGSDLQWTVDRTYYIQKNSMKSG